MKNLLAAMSLLASDPSAVKLASEHGLDILNLTWEDTGRWKDSSVGPNISDMTIQVEDHLMPVIRYPNFADKSADLRLKDFYVMVGNERGREPRKIPLSRLLSNVPAFLSTPEKWEGKHSLLAGRDSKVLVSAQACFLPIPKDKLAAFNPALYNYQSDANDPAVMTILATREGTSVALADGTVQKLYFNNKGQRAAFTGQRLSEFGGKSTGTVSAAGEEGLNMVLLIQVPLKQKERPRRYYEVLAAPAGAAGSMMMTTGKSDVEAAVIGHGQDEGPYEETRGLKIERDERFPIRVTVQFYKATSNAVVSAADMKDIAAQIKRVYEQSDYVGSLVVGGATGRKTETTKL